MAELYKLRQEALKTGSFRRMKGALGYQLEISPRDKPKKANSSCSQTLAY